ncbi:MAG: hypothetical protein V4616_09915 [Bacteroidota bacterium]
MSKNNLPLVLVLIGLVLSGCGRKELSIEEYRNWCSECGFETCEFVDSHQKVYVKLISPECKVLNGLETRNADSVRQRISAEENSLQIVLKIPKSVQQWNAWFTGDVGRPVLRINDSIYYPQLQFREESILSDSCFSYLLEYGMKPDYRELDELEFIIPWNDSEQILKIATKQIKDNPKLSDNNGN